MPPYSNPINYKGQYHYRSGSTKQELKGAALNKFLLERGGIHWDEYVVPKVNVAVWNYGQLPEGWTVGRLFVKHPSMPFNRSLANVFFRSGDIESWGRGYRRIVRGNEAAGLLPPIVETEDGLRVTHYVDVAAQVNAMGAEERAIPILEHVLKNHRVTNGDVQKMLGVSRATAMRILQKLDSLLEPVGQGAGGYYRIRKY